MSELTHVVALSGGKDSTAMALRLAEVEPRDYTYLITPTGDELPEMLEHWARLEVLLGKPLTRVTNGTLESWIETWGALPNWRQRWCTRVLKIQPALAFLEAHQPCVQYVGLRADEDENARKGLETDYRGVELRFPLREWGWGLPEVLGYLRERGMTIPKRTDCARCYGQRLGEWHALYRQHRDLYEDAQAQEAATGHTFRSPGRDRLPAPLVELRTVFDFCPTPESLKRYSRRRQGALDLDLEPEEEAEFVACKVCRL